MSFLFFFFVVMEGFITKILGFKMNKKLYTCPSMLFRNFKYYKRYLFIREIVVFKY